MKEYKITHKQLTKLLISSWKYNMIDDLGIDGLDESIEEITTEEIDEYIEETYSLHPTVPNEEVEGKWKQLENYVKDTLMGKIYIDELKQALTTPKFSEDDLEFIFKWANRGIWQEREKRFNIMRRIKNPSTLSCYKIIIKELNSNYDRIKTLKSIGGNK